MIVKGDGRLSCATPQKWVTWHFASCMASEWHQSSSSTLTVRLEECANTVIDEKRSKISQPVLNGTTNRTRPGQYVSSIVGDGSHGRPRRPEFTFQFREGVLTQTWCSSYVNRDSGLLHLRTESKTLLKFMESGNRVYPLVAILIMGRLCAALMLAYWLIMLQHALQMWPRHADLIWCFSAFKKGGGSDRRNDCEVKH